MDQFKAIIVDPSYHGFYLNGEIYDRDDSIQRLMAGEVPKTRSFKAVYDGDETKELYLLDPTQRELEAHYRSKGNSRSQAVALATAQIRKEVIPMDKRAQLAALEAKFEKLAWNKNRTDEQNEEYYSLIGQINGLKEELGGGVIPAPLTKPGPGAYGDHGVITIDGEVVKVPTGRDYCSMFRIPRAQLRRDGFKNFNDYLTVFSSGKYDERLNIRATASESVPSDGGFSTMPEMFAAWILDASLESEIVRPRATVWPMKSESLKVPGWDSGTHSSSLFGGLTGTWLAELGAATEVFAKMRQINLQVKKLACYTAASNELVADGVDYERQIQDALVKTLSWYMDYAFIQGTGSGQPLGIINSPSLVTVSKESGQVASTIVFENCVKMYARLAPQCMANAIWIANQTCVPQLLTMSLSVGTGGAPIQPAVLQSNGQFSLLGKPMLFTEKCPALGSLGQLLLVDPTQYAIGLRKEVSLDKSIHPGWSTDTSSYRAIVRVDGQGMWDKAITPKAGNTLSWCVALAA
jgi:HK97 family phage major capsid protein